MKKYRAVVLDGRKILRKIMLFCIVIFLFALLILYCVAMSDNITGYEEAKGEIIAESIPGFKGNSKGFKDEVTELISKVLSFNEPTKIIGNEILMSKIINEGGMVKKYYDKDKSSEEIYREIEEKLNEVYDDVEDTEIKIENRGHLREINLSPIKDDDVKVVIGNETSYKVDIEENLKSKPDIDMTKDGPKVLIIHTHATESYATENSLYYDTTAGDRNKDKNKNVVKVGDVITEIFNSKGIETIHDKSLHDSPSFNGSYASSLKSAEQYIKENPSIQIVLDIHRDSIVYEGEIKAKPITEIGGRKAAQLMFVIGTDEKGLYNPDWRENIKTAIHFQNEINKRYPTLMRHINLRKERFNCHTTHGSMIIETGSSGNTLSEAIYGLSLAAECLADYLNSLR